MLKTSLLYSFISMFNFVLTYKSRVYFLHLEPFCKLKCRFYKSNFLHKISTRNRFLAAKTQLNKSYCLLSVCLSVCLSVRQQVEILPCYSTQNVPECMQNVPECSRMHTECSRIFQNIPECFRMHSDP